MYVPNAGSGGKQRDFKVKFLRCLCERMDEYAAAGRQVIAVGDFNVAAQPEDSHWPLNEDFGAEELALLRGLIGGWLCV